MKITSQDRKIMKKVLTIKTQYKGGNKEERENEQKKAELAGICRYLITTFNLFIGNQPKKSTWELR